MFLMIDSISSPKEALFYKKTDGQDVQCLLCPRECVISDGKRGFCRNRENREELYILWSMVGLPLLTLVQLKKPLSTISFPAIFDYVSPVRVAI